MSSASWLSPLSASTFVHDRRIRGAALSPIHLRSTETPEAPRSTSDPPSSVIGEFGSLFGFSLTGPLSFSLLSHWLPWLDLTWPATVQKPPLQLDLTLSPVVEGGWREVVADENGLDYHPLPVLCSLSLSLLAFSLAQLVPSQPSQPESPRPTDHSRASPSHRSQPSLPVAPITASPPLPAPICPQYYSEIASQLKEIAIAFKNQGPVDANELYEAMMTTKGFAEEMLASAFDYMIQEEKVGRAFMAKAPKLRKLWLENYFTKNM
uniref:Uncharacterized protein n=1 Tax=Fagus sylvatica TaxID=28930 RepID=A0A2N9GGP5_FAGSY